MSNPQSLVPSPQSPINDELPCTQQLRKDAQEIFNHKEFRNDLGGFTSEIELSESEIELIKGVGACYYHIRKDEQVTIRKIAVLPQHQKQGWGRLLVYRVICRAIEEGKASVFLKCPDGSKANDFYQKLGFELEATEPSKKRSINHWRFTIKLPLLFYCGGGGKSEYDAIALQSGWSSGINSSGKNVAHQHMMMVDNDFKNYKHHQHLEMVQKNKPLIATALDIASPEQLPEVLRQAEELAQYAGRVLIIPKCDVEIPKKYWLGYSVDSGYGSTPLSPEWFANDGRPVHLLGGSPKKQALLYPQMNVISLDANYAMKLAKHYCKATWTDDGSKRIEYREPDWGCYKPLELSLKRQFQFWREKQTLNPKSEVSISKESDKWYTPPKVYNPVIEVLGEIDLDPCADDGKHIPALNHYTAQDDGLTQEWCGRVFMNPPYSNPSRWIAKLLSEIESGRVTEAIALVPASTDTNWLSPLLDKQPICFWRGRIKFLDQNYQPKQSARQSHCLLYWGSNPQKFKQVFDEFGVVKNVEERLTDRQQSLVISQEQKLRPSDVNLDVYVCDVSSNVGRVAERWQTYFAVDWGNETKVYFWERDEHLINEIAIAPQSLVDSFTPQACDTMKAISVPEEDKKVQFDADEVQFIREGDTSMTFQFSKTQEIAQQIEQLQKQLNALASSLRPLQECEQQAEELRQSVYQFAQEMANKGVSQSEIELWAKSLYESASEQEMQFLGDNATIAAQNDEIAQLKQELETLQKQREQVNSERVEAMALLASVTTERDKALAKLTGITAGQMRVARKLKSLRQENQDLVQKVDELEQLADALDATLSEEELIGEIEDLGQADTSDDAVQEVESDEPTLQENDIVQRQDGVVGTVVYIPTPFKGILSVKYPDGSFNNHASNLKLISRPKQNDSSGAEAKEGSDSDPKTHNLRVGDRTQIINVGNAEKTVAAKRRGRDYIENIKSRIAVNNANWNNISEICQGNIHAFESIVNCAQSKYQKDLVAKLPELMTDYILQTGDITDMQWVGEDFKTEVEALVEAKKQLAYHPGDWVRVVDDSDSTVEKGSAWQVTRFDGEWITAKRGNENVVTSFHVSEVEPYQEQQQVA